MTSPDPLFDEVDRILYEVWDPIGVRGRAPDDEYRSYAAGVLALLRNGADEVRVTEHLQRIERVSMGLGGARTGTGRAGRAAAALIAARDR